MTQPWECPRCGRINAPYNPVCSCKPEDDYVEESEMVPVFEGEIKGFNYSVKKCKLCGLPFHCIPCKVGKYE